MIDKFSIFKYNMLITTIPERMLQMRYSVKRTISTAANV